MWEYVISYISTSDCHVWEYVISYILTSHFTCGNTTFHISQQVMSRVWMSCISDVCSPAQHESTGALRDHGAATGHPAAPSGDQDEYWGIIYTYTRTHVQTSTNALQLQLGTPLPLEVYPLEVHMTIHSTRMCTHT